LIVFKKEISVRRKISADKLSAFLGPDSRQKKKTWRNFDFAGNKPVKLGIRVEHVLK